MGVFVVLTLAAALAVPLLTRLVGGRVSGWMCALIAASWFVYLVTKAPAILGGEPVSGSFAWIPSLDARFSWHLDGLALLMAMIVAGVGATVLLYAGAYASEAAAGRLLGLLLAFVAAMLGLVTADNIVALFVYWEATSLLSFLLIGFANEREDARRSAQQAALVTGAGGLALLAGLALVALEGGTWEMSELRADGWRAEGAIGSAALGLVALGAFTKSAQFPFHFWLPNAMVAPSPVSAYLHSAAMVKAGVFLLARVFPFFEGLDLWQALLVPAGGITAVLGAWFAVRQTDLKLLLAYTTVSALGTQVFLLGIGTHGALKAALVVLLAHALYKSALFLAVGTIDHAAGTRDVRRLRGIGRVLPGTSVVLALAALSLAGLPPALGYVGKETFLAVGQGSTAVMVLATAGATGILAVLAAWMLAVRPLTGRCSLDPAQIHPVRAELWIAPLALAVAGVAVGAVVPLIQPLIREAATATAGERVDVHLALIPASARAGIASAVILVTGAVLAFTAGARVLPALRPRLPNAGERGYDLVLGGMAIIARRVTVTIQSGYLSSYVGVILVVTFGLTGVAFLAGGLPAPPQDLGTVRVHEALIGAVIVVAGGAAAVSGSRMGAVAALGVVGVGIALLYGTLGAPDLAMTQLLVETVIVVLFVFVFSRLPRLRKLRSPRRRLRDASLAAAGGLLMMSLTWTVADAGGERPLAEFFGNASYPLAFGRNVVNVILVDFRALDTLGEIAVLAVAASGVLALLGAGRERRP